MVCRRLVRRPTRRRHPIVIAAIGRPTTSTSTTFDSSPPTSSHSTAAEIPPPAQTPTTGPRPGEGHSHRRHGAVHGNGAVVVVVLSRGGGQNAPSSDWERSMLCRITSVSHGCGDMCMGLCACDPCIWATAVRESLGTSRCFVRRFHGVPHSYIASQIVPPSVRQYSKYIHTHASKNGHNIVRACQPTVFSVMMYVYTEVHRFY